MVSEENGKKEENKVVKSMTNRGLFQKDQKKMETNGERKLNKGKGTSFRPF